MAELIKMRSVSVTKPVSQIADEVKSVMSAELVCDERKLNDRVVILCFEEFYLRCSSYVGLSVMLTEDDAGQEAVIAGFGGGDGFLNISWGANKSITKSVVKVLKENGFEIIEE